MAKRPQVKSHKLKTMPPPIGGINARDGISIMPESDAVDMVNWIPDSYGVRCRKGYVEWATNLDSAPGALNRNVSSIMYYAPADAALPEDPYGGTLAAGSLFAATDYGIYDISSPTASPASAIALSGAENAGVMSSTLLANVAGSFLCAASETDGYHIYNGTAWSKVLAGSTAGTLAGLDPALACFVTVWKRRLWLVEKDSTRAWYLPVDQVTGTATSFDFGSQFKSGGHLAYMANWTIDAGEGIDDFLVAVSSTGDVAVYKGNDPEVAGGFSLVGVFFIGRVPVGRRGWAQYGGDLVLLSTNGLYPMSFITRGGAGMLQATGGEYSSKISGPLGKDIQASFASIGWDMLLHPTEQIFVVSVPDNNGRRNQQYAMSTTLNKWTRFSDIPVRCFGRASNYAFAGTSDGRVIRVFTGYFDAVALGQVVGSGIRGRIQPAFSFFGTPAMDKQFLMVRPMFLATDKPAYTVTLQLNFSISAPSGNPAGSALEGGVWNTSTWGEAQWSGGLYTFQQWHSVGGIGFSGAAGLVTECIGETLLTAIDYMYADGGPM